MEKKFVVKKCLKCGALVKVFKDCTCENCGIKCCGEQMVELIPNSTDAAVEKHVPVCEVKDGKIYATVNHVMDEDHYIEWISIVTPNKECTTYFKPGEEAKAQCKYVENETTVYAYCNKHGLWKKEF